MNATLSKYVNEERLRWSLILITAFSWVIFPLLIVLLNPALFKIGFAVSALVVIISVAIALPKNQLALQPLHKMILVCWVGYLLALLLATLESGSTYSLTHWSIYFAKFLFLLFLLFYINEKYIVATFRIYANLMVLTVILAVFAVFVAAIDIQPLAIIDIQGTLTNFYFGSYYTPHYSPLCAPLPIYRIQGLSEEPGAYAFELLPAFFWLLIAERAYVRSAVIALGLVLTMSFGVASFLFVLLLLLLIARKHSNNYIVPASFLIVSGSIGLMYAISSSCQTSHLQNLLVTSQSEVAVVKSRSEDSAVVKPQSKDDAATLSVLEECKKNHPASECIDTFQYYVASTAYGKLHSLKDRFDGLSIALSQLINHPIGTGAALGMPKVNAIAAAAGASAAGVGYAVPVLESGIVGGLLYLCLFSIMGWLAIKTVTSSSFGSFDERVEVVVALSVCAVLAMGAQRIQPDVTLWHMWIYAMLFYLLQKKHSARAAC